MAELKYDKKTGRLLFTKQMKKEYTILMPNMAPIHFKILEKVFNYYGYKSDLLDTTGPDKRKCERKAAVVLHTERK